MGRRAASPLVARLVAAALVLCSGAAGRSPLPPVLLVPGDGGSRLEIKLNKAHHAPHFFCPRTSDWKLAWLQIGDLLPGAIDCWADNIRLVYDPATRKYSNAPGITTRVPGFGSTETVEFLDPSLEWISGYMDKLVERLVESGYERGRTIAAAPYDFRYSPRSQPDFADRTVALIEELHRSSGGQRVAVVSHSLGSLVTLYLLHSQDQAWKDKYVRSWTSFSGVFGGAAVEMKLHASGDNVGLNFVRSASVRGEQRTYETNMWMMPNPLVWPAEQVLLVSPNRNYTVADLDDFFADIGYAEGATKTKDALELSKGLSPPGVAVHLLTGVDVPTPARFEYTKGSRDDWFESDPTSVVNGDGDGTVSALSLEAPRRWAGGQQAPVEWSVFPGIDHRGILSHAPALNTLLQILRGSEAEFLLRENLRQR